MAGGGVSTTITVTYNDTTNTYSYNSSTITFKVPIDTEYTITVADNVNYRIPDPYTRTAVGGNSISITIAYLDPIPDNGVYIYGADGEFYTTDSWTQGSNATGVAVITDQVRLVVAPDRWYTNDGVDYDGAWNGNKISAWGGYGKTVTGIVTTEDQSIALTDFAGSSNTDQIIAQLKGTTDDYSSSYTGAPAAEYCRAYSSGCKGVGEWHLPSAGEMNVLVTNRNAILVALNRISGEPFIIENSDGWIVTSTQKSSTYIWGYRWFVSNYVNFNKSGSHEVRPVCQL